MGFEGGPDKRFDDKATLGQACFFLPFRTDEKGQ